MNRSIHIAAALCALVGVARAEVRNELTAKAGLDSAYDDNVFNGRGPDFVNRVNPHVSWRLVGRRIHTSASYDLGVWTYALGKADNSINHRAAVSIEGQPARRLILKASDEFVRAEDPGYITRLGVVAPQIGIIDNVAEFNASVNFTRRFYAGLNYLYHHTSFDRYTDAQIMAGYPALYDGDEHNIDSAWTVRLGHKDDLRMFGRAQVFTAGPQNTDSSRWAVGAAYSPAVGFRHAFLPELELTADAGPLYYQQLAGAVNIPGAAGSGTTWRGGTRLRWFTPMWRASISYSHDLLGATGIGNAIWADYVYAQAGFHWLDRLDISLGGGYFRNGRAVDQEFAYDGFTADALVDVSVVRYFRVGAYYTLRWQQTGPGAIPPGMPAAQFPDITRNIVGIRLLAVIGADARPPRREVHE
jgi:hypothetical protein